tara:strand:- start:720 stop:1172 length:453 start_codon:yes stop_codon:yes gene_type:complete
MNSDFDNVEWIDVEQASPVLKEIAPVGEHNAKVVSAEKYESQKGNQTVKVTFELGDGSYREHNEWYNLWAANPEAKKISNELFTHLSKAVGFKQFPGSVSELVNKTLTLSIYHKEEKNEMTGDPVTRTKIGRYSEFKSDIGTPPKSKPPF